MDEDFFYKVILFFGGLLVLFLIVFGMFGYPLLKVWYATQEGRAELAQAEQNRQIKVKEAQATKDSAILLADAEVLRAEGVAKANKIIGASLHDNEEYLRYLYINALTESDVEKEVIYIPTEAGLPILEAGRSK